MALTLNIVAKLLFGADLAADARDIGTTIIGADGGLQRRARAARADAVRQPADPARLAHPAPRARPGSHHLQADRRPPRAPPNPGHDLLVAAAAGARRGRQPDDRPAASRRGADPVRRRPRDHRAGADLRALPAGHPSRAAGAAGRRAAAGARRIATPGSPISSASTLDRGRAARVDAPLPARLEHRPRGAGGRRDRRLPDAEGLDVLHLPVGHAPRSRALRRPGAVSTRALGSATRPRRLPASPTFPSAAARASASATASR